MSFFNGLIGIVLFVLSIVYILGLILKVSEKLREGRKSFDDEMGSRQESNWPPENHITSGESCSVNAIGGRSNQKLNGEVGTSIPGSLQDHDEVIVWQGKSDLFGGLISEPLENFVEMSNPNVKIHDSLPLGCVSLSQLESLRESKTGIESEGTSKQKISTVSRRVQRSEDQAMDKKSEQKEGLRALGKEVKQRGTSGSQVGGKDENQPRQSENCEVYKGEKGKSVNIYETVGMNEKDDGREQPHGSAGVRSRKSEQHEGMKESQPFKKGNKQLPCQLVSNLDDMSLASDCRRKDLEESRCGKKIVEAAKKSENMVKLQVENESSTATEKKASLKGEVYGGHTVKNGIMGHAWEWRVEVPLGASRTTTDGTYTCQKSDKYEESWNGNTGSENAVLNRNTGIKYKAPDKEKQIQSGKSEVSNGQNIQNNKKGEAVRKDKTIVNGPAHNVVNISSKKPEQKNDKKELKTSKRGNKNGHKEPLLKGISTSKDTTGRHGFLESVNDMDREMSSNHAENQVLMLEENGEGGICVFHPFLFKTGRPRSIKKGEKHMAAILVVNNGKDSAILFAVKLVNLRPSNSFSLSHTTGPVKSRQCENLFCLSTMDSLKVNTKSIKTSQHNTGSISLMKGPWLIEPKHHLTINLSCKANDIGLLRTSILFDFPDQKITQHVILLAEDDVSEQLAPVEPYSVLKKRERRNFGRILRGVPPPLPRYPKKLKAYDIPHKLKEMAVEMLPRVLEKGLSVETYSKYFSTLLYLEELQLKKDISSYDMCNATMRISGQYLVLKVPGLSEKRPSLVHGDEVYVTTCQAKGTAYQGYIHRIEANEIYVKFNNSFHKNFIPMLQYNVHFSFNRTSFRRCHKAVESACRMDESILFPSLPLARTGVKVSMNDPFNRHLNKEQLSSVHQILNCTGLPPYIVYGPPGTGKTATLVEAILQVLRSNVNACILACAPSNVASDLLVERLIGPVQKREIFRLNAVSRPYKDVSPPVLPYCYYRDSIFCCPPLKDLLNYKIIISTFSSASILDAQGLPQGHFTHIFLDESGQGTEPEIMVPISNFANIKTTVVLAGDPQQLGPVVFSPIAAKFGLGKSYLERLSELQLYGLDGGNAQFVTKLVRNYRSHPAILELPSQLFYGNKLIACAANGIRNLLSDLDELPNKKFPVVFFGIEGCDEKEGSSPSWFNTIEVSKVLDIVKKIKDNKRNSVIGKDIGVITPYRQQVVKLKKAFAANALSDVKIGSVEQFQGDEKLVIIISTVRSSYKNEEFDKKYNLGFIGHPKRFNVAVTRAKSLLVVVGNPYILSKDRYWNELLQYCVSHKSYIGCLLPPKSNGDEFIPTNALLPDEGSVDYGASRFIDDMEWPDSSC